MEEAAAMAVEEAAAMPVEEAAAMAVEEAAAMAVEEAAAMAVADAAAMPVEEAAAMVAPLWPWLHAAKKRRPAQGRCCGSRAACMSSARSQSANVSSGLDTRKGK